MSTEIQYVHTNLIALDWKKLAMFYVDVFNCEPILPERDLSGDWLAQLTNIEKATIKGIHLRLPGYDGSGPTLEIFEYNRHEDSPKLINQLGFGHIAFHVNNLQEMLKSALANGASMYGEAIEKSIENIGLLKAVYIKDPEGKYY